MGLFDLSKPFPCLNLIHALDRLKQPFWIAKKRGVFVQQSALVDGQPFEKGVAVIRFFQKDKEIDGDSAFLSFERVLQHDGSVGEFKSCRQVGPANKNILGHLRSGFDLAEFCEISDPIRGSSPERAGLPIPCIFDNKPVVLRQAFCAVVDFLCVS